MPNVVWLDVTKNSPPDSRLVWIHDAYYHGVTIGYLDGNCWCNYDGSDDVSVTHFAYLDPPDEPVDTADEL